MSENSIVIPRKLIHPGKKRAYPSSFIGIVLYVDIGIFGIQIN